MTVHTWTIEEVCGGVATTLAEAFPDEFWVRGEIQNLRRSPAGHLYFDLIDPAVPGRHRGARLAVVAFRGPLRGIEAVLRKVGDLEMTDGIEVRIRGRVEFYAPQGRVQFIMNAIDPRHTLGQLSADRDRVMRALATEGLLEKNGALPIPLVPLNVGLITSDGSAAYSDFVDELETSGFSFRVTLADSRVQGRDAVDGLIAAIRHLSSLQLDLIAIVRGGGGKGDLLAFDQEGVARAVAAASVPVVVGIGHEIDRSVVDEVAHTSLKTPTACAVALVDQVRNFIQRLDQLSAAARHHGLRTIDRALVRLDNDAARLLRSTSTSLDSCESTLQQHSTSVERLTRISLDAASARLGRGAGRMVAASGLRLRQASADLMSLTSRLAPVARRAVSHADRRLNAADSVVRAVHPHRTLSRGYSITRGASGSALRSTLTASPGDKITTELIDGQLTSTIVETVPHTETSPKDS